MREIKFRAWDNKNGIFPFIGFHLFGECTMFNVLEQYTFEESITQLAFQQYTGLCDVNGKDIYEHDYVNFIYDCFTTDMKPLHVERVMFIKWMGAGFDMIDKGGCIRLNHTYELKNRGFGNATFEVVGNMYENPELVTVIK